VCSVILEDGCGVTEINQAACTTSAFDSSCATTASCVHVAASKLTAAHYCYCCFPSCTYVQPPQVHTNRRIADILHETDGQGRPVHVTGLKITGGGGDREEIREFDTIIAATDVPGIKKLLPASFRAGYPFFDRYYCTAASLR
jgi:hypothetical protein